MSALYLPLQAGEHISLGNAYHCDGGNIYPFGGTHIPSEMCSGEHISLGIYVRGNTYPRETHITVTPGLVWREEALIRIRVATEWRN